MLKNSNHLLGDPLLRMAAGNIFSMMLQVGIELDVFAKLKGKAVPAGELGALWGMPSSSARVLAQYLTHLGVLTYAQGRVSNTPLSETYLSEDTWTRHRAHYFCRGAGFNLTPEKLKQKLLDPPTHRFYQIRDGELDAHKETWWRGGQENRISWGEGLAVQYDFSRHKLLLDVGGATGGWCIGIRKRFPHLRCIVFDIAPAAQMAVEMIAQAGEQNRVSVVAGSFFTDPLPQGADVALLANVLHDWTPEIGSGILQKTYHSLAENGVVLVKEFFLEDDWSGATESIIEAMWVVGPEGKSGWQPTYEDIENMLTETGFVDVKRSDCLVLGRKPER